jgi:hypothetical protein
MRVAFATVALLAFLFVPSTAPAQPVYVPAPAPDLSANDVQAIAVENGVATFYRVRLDEGVWKIEGRDFNGRYITMRIDPRTGQLVSFDRGW